MTPYLKAVSQFSIHPGFKKNNSIELLNLKLHILHTNNKRAKNTKVYRKS